MGLRRSEFLSSLPKRIKSGQLRVANKVFLKLGINRALTSQPRKGALGLMTQFRLYCVDGLSAERVARKCRCAKGTVMSRLRFIETVTKTRPEQFRAVSGHLQQVDDDLNASGAREIYRQGLAEGNDE